MIKFGGQTIINLKDEIDAGRQQGQLQLLAERGSPFDTGYGPANVLLRRGLELSARSSTEPEELDLSRHPRVRAGHLEADRPSHARLRRAVLSHADRSTTAIRARRSTAVFLPSKWDPAKAPRFYVPYAANTALIVDPASPNTPLPVSSQVANVLRYTIVPGSGDPLNGVVPLGDEFGNAGMPEPKALLVRAARRIRLDAVREPAHAGSRRLRLGLQPQQHRGHHQPLRERPRRAGQPRADQLQHDGVVVDTAADPGAQLWRARRVQQERADGVRLQRVDAAAVVRRPRPRHRVCRQHARSISR